MKRLYKTRTGKLCGVCEGLAEYGGIDPTLVRFGFIVFGCFGAGLIAYIAAAIVMPYKDEVM